MGASGRQAASATDAAPLNATIRKRRRPGEWVEIGF